MAHDFTEADGTDSNHTVISCHHLGYTVKVPKSGAKGPRGKCCRTEEKVILQEIKWVLDLMIDQNNLFYLQIKIILIYFIYEIKLTYYDSPLFEAFHKRCMHSYDFYNR